MTVDEALKYIISMGVVAPRPHAPRRIGAVAPRAATPQPTRRPPRIPEIDRAATRAPARRAWPAADACRGRRCPNAMPDRTTRPENCRETHRLLRPHRPPLPRPDRHADGLGPPPPRPRRRDLHRPARPRRPGAGRLRSRPRRDLRDRRDAAQRIRHRASPASCGRAPRARSTRTSRRGEIEVLAHELEILNRVADAAVPARRREPVGDRAPRAPRARPAPRRRCRRT